jgi:hypothetical protein
LSLEIEKIKNRKCLDFFQKKKIKNSEKVFFLRSYPKKKHVFDETTLRTGLAVRRERRVRELARFK